MWIGLLILRFRYKKEMLQFIGSIGSLGQNIPMSDKYFRIRMFLNVTRINLLTSCIFWVIYKISVYAMVDFLVEPVSVTAEVKGHFSSNFMGVWFTVWLKIIDKLKKHFCLRQMLTLRCQIQALLFHRSCRKSLFTLVMNFW